LPVHYYAGSRTDSAQNVTSGYVQVETRKDAFSYFDINHIDDGSELIWIHLLFSYLVTFVTCKFIKRNYRLYAETLVRESLSQKSSKEQYERRTIIGTILRSNV
jgi:hypothetical protein